MSKPENPPAYPQITTAMHYADTNSSNFAGHLGLSMRDHSAGQAMVGVMGNNDVLTSIRCAYASEELALSQVLAKFSYRVADAMLEERNRK